jgi:hypothetical protein
MLEMLEGSILPEYHTQLTIKETELINESFWPRNLWLFFFRGVYAVQHRKQSSID